MGKIVKYCTKCEEGFAEKFGFCPNCGENLQAFEMNPVQAETATVNASVAESVEAETFSPAVFEAAPQAKEQVVPAATAAFADNDILELDSVDISEEPETLIEAAAPTDSNGDGNGFYPTVDTEIPAYKFSDDKENTAADADDYSPTVIVEKDVQVRNGLLAGFGTLIMAAVLIAWVWSLFVHSLPVFALEDEGLFAFVGPIEPEPIDIEKPPKKNDKEGGGGGGGGKENPTPVNKGRLPTQMENPPNQLLTVTQMSKPEFLVQNATKGNIKREMTDQPIGLPNGLSSDLSGGPGRGGGIGGGNGSGAGNGNGLGEGNGNGSGSGNGNGNGNGDGDGDGDNDGAPKIAKVVKPAGVTVPIKIVSKPQARYTDAGRTNNVQGTVTLKVTFTASGTIGSITTVSGLPYGLTEQAIAAARQIKFEPPKKDGVPYATTRTISYTFTIY
jgi:TonB family protein